MSMRLRSGTVADVETFTRLINAQHQWLRGEDLWQTDELAALLVSPTSDPVRYDRYLEVDGVAVAAIHTHTSPPFDKGTLYLACPPQPRRAHHARYLLEAGLRLLRSRPQLHDASTINIDIPSEDTELIELVRSAGFARANQVAIMEGLTSDIEPPSHPEGVTLEEFGKSADLRLGYAVIRAAFADHPVWWHIDEADFLYMMRKDPTALAGLSMVLRRHDEAVGIAVNFQDTTRRATGLVGLLAVMPHAQGLGLGRLLLLESFSRFRNRGWGHARLATIYGYHAGEPSVYQSVGMKSVYFNDTYLRSLN